MLYKKLQMMIEVQEKIYLKVQEILTNIKENTES